MGIPARSLTTLSSIQAPSRLHPFGFHMSPDPCFPHRKTIRGQWVPRWQQQISRGRHQQSRVRRSANTNTWFCHIYAQLAGHHQMCRLPGLLLDHPGHCVFGWNEKGQHILSGISGWILYLPVAGRRFLSPSNQNHFEMVGRAHRIQYIRHYHEGNIADTRMHFYSGHAGRMCSGQIVGYFVHSEVWAGWFRSNGKCSVKWS